MTAASTHVAPVRVMICDDSAVIRRALATILSAAPGITVVASMANGLEAVETLKRIEIDVVVLDIEMPVMDGLTALPLLLAHAPGLPVIMASSLTTKGAEVSLRALRLGAADTLAKPSATDLPDGRFGPELIAKIRGLARLRRSAHASAVPAQVALRAAAPLPPRLLAIGSSTGGPNALFSLVQQLGPGLPVPIVITQHMPATFTPILAQHIDRLGVPCAEAMEGDVLMPGRILLAPGDRHLVIQGRGASLAASLSQSPPENFCRPAVDVMLRSACAAAGGRVLVAMLTGMGQDGLLGARQIVEAGGALVAQDEASSVVWGMPGAVARAGLAHAVLPLAQMGARLKTMIGAGLPARRAS